jgi:hypothetical protein
MIRHRTNVYPSARTQISSTQVGESDLCQPEWLGVLLRFGGKNGR